MTASAHEAPALRAARIACWIFLITGLLMVDAVIFGLDAPLGWLVDLVFWPLDGQQNALAPETLLVAGIAGGLLAGWAATLLILLRHAPVEALAGGWAWRAAAVGLGAWFVLDSAASLAVGAGANVIGNLVFLLALGLPLLALRRAATGDPARV